MKSNVRKILLVFVIAFLVCGMLTSVFASTPEAMLSIVKSQANNSANGNVVNSTKNIVGAIITITRVITAAVAITMLIVLAMKYMSSAPGDRATIKKHAVVYIVGAVIMFACTGILGIIQKFASGL